MGYSKYVEKAVVDSESIMIINKEEGIIVLILKNCTKSFKKTKALNDFPANLSTVFMACLDQTVPAKLL